MVKRLSPTLTASPSAGYGSIGAYDLLRRAHAPQRRPLLPHTLSPNNAITKTSATQSSSPASRPDTPTANSPVGNVWAAFCDTTTARPRGGVSAAPGAFATIRCPHNGITPVRRGEQASSSPHSLHPNHIARPEPQSPSLSKQERRCGLLFPPPPDPPCPGVLRFSLFPDASTPARPLPVSPGGPKKDAAHK